MLAKSSLSVMVLYGSFVLTACGGTKGGSTTGTGGSSGSGGSGGATTTGTTGGGGTGATGGGGTGGTGGTGGATTTSTSTGTTTMTMTGCQPLGDACTGCLAEKCNMTYCSCYDNATCGALAQCSQGCQAGDANCQQACFMQNQGGIADAALLNDCGATNCAATCPGTAKLDVCTKCFFTTCPGDISACLADSTCSDFLTCVQKCNGDSGCQQDCYFANLNGKVDDIVSCVQDKCSAQCG